MEKKRILIVDRLKVSNKLYEQILRHENYDVEISERGGEVIPLLRKEEGYDLIILNLNLPDMSGIEVLKRLRKIDKEVLVLLIIGQGSRETILKATKYNINGCLVKPINVENLKVKVHQLLDGSVEEKEEESESDQILQELSQIVIDPEMDPRKKELKRFLIGVAKEYQKVELAKKRKDIKEKVLWKKEVECPICGLEFETTNYKRKSLPIDRKDADFHEWYNGFAPLIYDMCTCPRCYYSAKREEFTDLTKREIKEIKKGKTQREELVQNLDFYDDRNYELGLMSYKLAMLDYQKRGAKAAFLGSINLKAAWLARENSDNATEIHYLEQTIDYYEKALSTGEKIGGKLSETGLIYLLGELYRRTGRLNKAGKYFLKAKQDANINEKYIKNMAVEQLEKVKKEKEDNKN